MLIVRRTFLPSQSSASKENNLNFQGFVLSLFDRTWYCTSIHIQRFISINASIDLYYINGMFVLVYSMNTEKSDIFIKQITASNILECLAFIFVQ